MKNRRKRRRKRLAAKRPENGQSVSSRNKTKNAVNNHFNQKVAPNDA